MTAAVNEA